MKRAFPKVNVVCQNCRKEFPVVSSVVWHTRLCPDCRNIERLRQGRERTRHLYAHTCKECEKIIYGHNGTTKYCRDCYWKVGYKYRRPRPHRFTDSFGYVWVYAKEYQKQYNRTRLFMAEHRMVMEQSLKRPLMKNEVVHHINGLKSDNRIKNLSLMPRKHHEQNTLLKIAQKRIRELENELNQQKLC